MRACLQVLSHFFMKDWMEGTEISASWRGEVKLISQRALNGESPDEALDRELWGYSMSSVLQVVGFSVVMHLC